MGFCGCTWLLFACSRIGNGPEIGRNVDCVPLCGCETGVSEHISTTISRYRYLAYVIIVWSVLLVEQWLPWACSWICCINEKWIDIVEPQPRITNECDHCTMPSNQLYKCAVLSEPPRSSMKALVRWGGGLLFFSRALVSSVAKHIQSFLTQRRAYLRTYYRSVFVCAILHLYVVVGCILAVIWFWVVGIAEQTILLVASVDIIRYKLSRMHPFAASG